MYYRYRWCPDPRDRNYRNSCPEYHIICSTCRSGGSDSTAFLPDVNGTEDSLTFRYIPKDETPGTYLVSYEIYENGAVMRSEKDKTYAATSPENPVVIPIARQRNATYTMNMSILKDGASCPYQSRVSIATGIAE